MYLFLLIIKFSNEIQLRITSMSTTVMVYGTELHVVVICNPRYTWALFRLPMFSCGSQIIGVTKEVATTVLELLSKAKSMERYPKKEE